MELSIFTFVILIGYIVIGSMKIKKLEMKNKELQWRIGSLEHTKTEEVQ
jgi:hypothetical protein